jgi:hypothetical protein
MSKKKDNPGIYVTHGECLQVSGDIKAELVTIKKTLVGEDMRGGLVKDVQEIKSATSAIKTVAVPIIVAVIASLITAAILCGLGLR